ncbi:50S ribosomal protein L6 [Cryomorphaceae bacterium]|nr:50S ribosomal protein L6 [Cryomorphaceae bacterium]
MSRIGKNPIEIPQGAEIKIDGQMVTVKGPKGELSHEINEGISVSMEDGILEVKRANDSKDLRALHGTNRALLSNMIQGVTTGFTKSLELVGVGYRASNQGQKLDLSLGFSHNIVFEIPAEVKLETKSEKGQNPQVILSSHDNQLLGMVAAKIRAFRKPEPYKGKGVRFTGEHIRRKAGKAAG